MVKIVKIAKKGQDGPRWSKMAGPTYRPERPKGARDEVKKLEVGARRAPRLLVILY